MDNPNRPDHKSSKNIQQWTSVSSHKALTKALDVIERLLEYAEFSDFFTFPTVTFDSSGPADAPILELFQEMGLLSFDVDDMFGETHVWAKAQDLKEARQTIQMALQVKLSIATPKVSSTATKHANWLKWNVIKPIWRVYESNSRSDSVFVPIAAMPVNGKGIERIDGVVDGFKHLGGFESWQRKDRYYIVEHINHELFPQIFESVGQTVKGPSVEETQTKELPTWPPEYKWKDAQTYQFNSEDGIKFSGNRLKIFKTIVDEHGEYISLKKISAETGISEKDVRTTCWQINKRSTVQGNNLSKYLQLTARNDKYGKPGAIKAEMAKPES